MNHFSGYVQEVHMGYCAMLRLAKDARANPILGEGGHPIIFATEAEAWREVTMHLLAYFNGSLRRDGETVSATLSAADALFPTLVRQKGSSRRTKVERKRRRVYG